jgi:hypothetical protein
MVDTTNNTAENQAEQPNDNPQRILERRLAELNARKNGEQSRTSEEINEPGNVMGGAVAMHEVIPPVPAVPVVGETPAASGMEKAPADSFGGEDFSPLATTQNGLPATNPAREEPTAASITPEPTNNLAAGMGDPAIATPEFTGTRTEDPVSDLSSNAHSDQAQTEELPSTGSATTDPESLSTAGIIPADNPDSMTAPAADSPEAAGSVTEAPQPAPPLGIVFGQEHELLMDEEHHEEFVSDSDYSNFSSSELRQKLMQVLKTATRQQARQVSDMYRQYEAKLAVDKAEALDRFISEGGSADDFEYQPGSEHQELEKAYQQFRDLRNREQRQDEEQKVRNAKRKQELLDQLRELVESPETKSSGEKIRQIQTEWKAIGPVPPADSKQLWNSYHALLDIFYNNRSIFYELKELDRRKNLQHKLQLCERAESLINQPSINTALQELRNLHEEWKNVGPVPNEHRDSIWERFIQASEKVHARKKEFIAERKSHELENLVKKTQLLERMEAFQTFQTDRINDWRDKTDEIQKLKEEWDAAGLVPKERADEINKRFWSSYKAFFNHKNAFFKNLDEQKMQNLRLKTELCEQAESLRDSSDWDETKEKLIQLQKRWKTIGRIPDKYSEKLWQRFRSACNEFFDRKQNQVSQREAELNQATEVKQTYLEELASRLTSINTEPGSYEEYERLRNRWLGLPSNKATGKQDDRYFDMLQKYINSVVDLSTEEKDAVMAELQVTRYKQGPDASNRIHQKEQAIKRDISQLENDIRTLKTNIEFFGRSKNAEKLREEYQSRIAEADHRIQQLQRQLYVFRNT